MQKWAALSLGTVVWGGGWLYLFPSPTPYFFSNTFHVS